MNFSNPALVASLALKAAVRWSTASVTVSAVADDRDMEFILDDFFPSATQALRPVPRCGQLPAGCNRETSVGHCGTSRSGSGS